jgi:hypothetical protein
MTADRPVEPHDYAAINLAWAAALGGILAAARDDAPRPAELPLYGLAAFALSKALAKEKVGAWVRDPVVDEDGDRREPKGSGIRYALGELLTCTRCVGTWSSLGLIGLRVMRPREGRIVATVLATAGTNDFLQSSFSWLCAKANAQAQLGDAPLHEWPSQAPRFDRG